MVDVHVCCCEGNAVISTMMHRSPVHWRHRHTNNGNALWSVRYEFHDNGWQILQSLFASFHKWTAKSDAKVVQLFRKCQIKCETVKQVAGGLSGRHPHTHTKPSIPLESIASGRPEPKCCDRSLTRRTQPTNNLWQFDCIGCNARCRTVFICFCRLQLRSSRLQTDRAVWTVLVSFPKHRGIHPIHMILVSTFKMVQCKTERMLMAAKYAKICASERVWVFVQRTRIWFPNGNR